MANYLFLDSRPTAPYYIGGEITFEFTAQNDQSTGPDSATVDVYNPAGTKIIDAGSATVNSTTVSYTLQESYATTSGLYRAAFHCVWGTTTRSHVIAALVQPHASGIPFYGSVPGVEALVGDIVASRQFTTSTTPTYSQVYDILARVASEINIELERQGYAVPIDPSSDLQAFIYIQHANNAGAAARVLSMLPMQTYTMPGEEQRGGDRREMLDNELERALQRIRDQTLPATRSTAILAHLYSGAEEDRSTGETKKPLFTRGLFDYPGSRTLQED